jgi:hypothetical protein
MTFYNQVNAITTKFYIPKIADAIFDTNPTLNRSKKKGWYKTFDGGETIMAPLNYATEGGGWFDGYDTLTTYGVDNISAAEYTLKQLEVPVAISRKEELQNSGKAQIVSLVESKMKIAEKTLADKLGTGIFSASTNSKSIVGLGTILGTSNTVGGISQTTYSWWQSQLDSTTTTLTLGAMQTLFQLCTFDNEQPSVGLSTRTIYNKLYALLTPQQRFVDTETASAGFTSIMFNGIPILVDSHQATAALSFINESNLFLYVHSKENMRFEEFQKPINQAVSVGRIYWAGALCSTNNRTHGGFTAITA